jgi:hypothetical protein
MDLHAIHRPDVIGLHPQENNTATLYCPLGFRDTAAWVVLPSQIVVEIRKDYVAGT